jgi:hypothetical protein
VKFTLYLALISALIVACSTKQTVIDAPTGGTTEGTTTTGTTTGDTPDIGNDVTVDLGKTAEEDVPKPSGQCDPRFDSMHLSMGMPCTSNSECKTCYCYDEAYLAPFRFCTKDCSSGVGSSCSDESRDPEEFKCLKFTSKHVNDHELTIGGLCMPTCQSVEDCKIYAPAYGHCPSSTTKWEGSTVQARKTCQTTAQ